MSNDTPEFDQRLVDELETLLSDQPEMVTRACLAVALSPDPLPSLEMDDLLAEAPEGVADTLTNTLAVIAVLADANLLSPLTREGLMGLFRSRAILVKVATLATAAQSVDLKPLRQELAENGVEGFTNE